MSNTKKVNKKVEIKTNNTKKVTKSTVKKANTKVAKKDVTVEKVSITTPECSCCCVKNTKKSFWKKVKEFFGF